MHTSPVFGPFKNGPAGRPGPARRRTEGCFFGAQSQWTGDLSLPSAFHHESGMTSGLKIGPKGTMV
jgi:hypothetical protein